MKTLLIASLFSFSAFACPNLAGNYKACRSVEGTSDISYEQFSVVQRMDGKVHIFHISSVDELGERSIDTYKADGKVYSQEINNEEDGTYTEYTTKATCSGNELKIESAVFSEKMTVVLSKEGKKLVQKMNGTILGMNVDAKVVCE